MKYFYFFLISVMFFSCGTQREIKTKPSSHTNSGTITGKGKAKDVISEAKKYIGTPYKFGGTSSSGMDCSGLILNSFDKINYKMPRISRDQAKEGKKISIASAKPGDLLFFNTSGRGISHVGIVESIKNKEVFFIHASSSKGVMISSLKNVYWKPRFVMARRVL